MSTEDDVRSALAPMVAQAVIPTPEGWALSCPYHRGEDGLSRLVDMLTDAVAGRVDLLPTGEETLALTPTDNPKRARDVAYLDQVRPPGWFGYYTVLEVQPLPEGAVRVLWRCDPGDNPPEPSTVFTADAWMAVR